MINDRGKVLSIKLAKKDICPGDHFLGEYIKEKGQAGAH